MVLPLGWTYSADEAKIVFNLCNPALLAQRKIMSLASTARWGPPVYCKGDLAETNG